MPVASAAGPILDYSDGRLLYVDLTEATYVLRILDTTTGQEEPLAAVLDGQQNEGRITALGAVYSAYAGPYPQGSGGSCVARERRNGTDVELGLIDCWTLKVAGAYATFVRQGASGSHMLVRRALETGLEDEITPLSIGFSETDVAANGDVVYGGADGKVYRWREGVLTDMSGGLSSASRDSNPKTDGVTVLFRRSDSYRQSLWGNSGAGATEYASSSGSLSDYAIRDGWVVFRRPDSVGQYQVWRHGSSGVEQVSFFSTGSSAEAIGSDGTILFSHGGRRYRAAPNTAAQDVGLARGRIVHRGGVFYEIFGGTVLRVGP